MDTPRFTTGSPLTHTDPSMFLLLSPCVQPPGRHPPTTDFWARGQAPLQFCKPLLSHTHYSTAQADPVVTEKAPQTGVLPRATALLTQSFQPTSKSTTRQRAACLSHAHKDASIYIQNIARGGKDAEGPEPLPVHRC